MVLNKRYLTKSLFNTSRECASRLYYAKRDEYPSVKDEDEFLQSLAEGGMQVGELACMMHPGGRAIETLNSAGAIALTDEELQKENVTLYEPAISYDDKFPIRVKTSTARSGIRKMKKGQLLIHTNCSHPSTLKISRTMTPVKSLSLMAAAP
jgi:hypothetical protein